MTKVYLAGAIERAPDGGVGWRRELTPFLSEQLGWEVFDPTLEEAHALTAEEAAHFRTWKREDFPRFQAVVRRIIALDLGELKRSDVVICLWDEHVTRGGGTHGEMTLAHHWGIPVHLVETLPRDEMSSWILGCATTVHPNFETLRQALLRDCSTPKI